MFTKIQEFILSSQKYKKISKFKVILQKSGGIEQKTRENDKATDEEPGGHVYTKWSESSDFAVSEDLFILSHLEVIHSQRMLLFIKW